MTAAQRDMPMWAEVLPSPAVITQPFLDHEAADIEAISRLQTRRIEVGDPSAMVWPAIRWMARQFDDGLHTLAGEHVLIHQFLRYLTISLAVIDSMGLVVYVVTLLR